MARIGLIAAWVAVAALATGLAWGALSSADRQVGAAPAVPMLTVPSAAEDAIVTTTTISNTTTISDTTAISDITTSSTTTTSSPQPGAGDTTTSTTPTTTTSTTPTTTTGPDSSAWTSLTVPSDGGVVVVGHRPGEVRLESATPAPGYTMEIDEQGPGEVRVEFEGASDEYRIRVRWRDAALDIEVERR